MNEGDVVLTPLPQANGALKNRLALLLRKLPPFGDYLVCGISSQTGLAVPEFDEIVRSSDADFPGSRLVTDSVIRLGFMAVVARACIAGSIGSISRDGHERLLMRLSAYLVEEISKTR